MRLRYRTSITLLNSLFLSILFYIYFCCAVYFGLDRLGGKLTSHTSLMCHWQIHFWSAPLNPPQDPAQPISDAGGSSGKTDLQKGRNTAWK